MSAVTVLLVDDHPVFRLGLRAALGAFDEIDIVGEAATISEAVHLATTLIPEIILLDVQLPDGSGVDAIAALRVAAPSTRVLMMTMYRDEATVAAALRAGASGFLAKGSPAGEIERAVRSVADGGTVLGADVASAALANLQSSPVGAPVPGLTPREHELLSHLATGLDNAAIARRMYLAPKTVRNAVSTLVGKLGAANRSEAAEIGRRAGLG